MTSPEAEIVVGCDELEPAIAALVDEHGWRLDTIFPADDPAQVVLTQGSQRLRLIRGNDLLDPEKPASPRDVPTARLTEAVVSRLVDNIEFGSGRAGMTYRDLMPDRLGGALIASHIRIDDEGPVSDYVHFHDVGFQLIFCRKGWVEVVYEDQGAPFVLRAGDAVLQPPGIRHRVLRASAGLEVIELASPSNHATHRDHELELPNRTTEPACEFGGQEFVHHIGEEADEVTSRIPGYVVRDIGLGVASRGVVEAGVHRSIGGPTADVVLSPHWTFFFVLDGTAAVEVDGTTHRLDDGDSIVIPAGCVVHWSGGLILEVASGPL